MTAPVALAGCGEGPLRSGPSRDDCSRCSLRDEQPLGRRRVVLTRTRARRAGHADVVAWIGLAPDEALAAGIGAEGPAAGLDA